MKIAINAHLASWEAMSTNASISQGVSAGWSSGEDVLVCLANAFRTTTVHNCMFGVGNFTLLPDWDIPEGDNVYLHSMTRLIASVAKA